MQGWTRRAWLGAAGTGILAAGQLRVARATTEHVAQAGEPNVNSDVLCMDVADTMPGEILRQTLHVRTRAGTGTAFTVEVDDRQYIVTAQHVLGSPSVQTVEMQNGLAGWRRMPVTVVASAGPPVDVAVLAANSLLGARSAVPVGVGTVSYGQAVRFLGYPFGLEFTPIPGFRAAPLPFVKAGILSALRPVSNEEGLLELLSMPQATRGSAEDRWCFLDARLPVTAPRLGI